MAPPSGKLSIRFEKIKEVKKLCGTYAVGGGGNLLFAHLCKPICGGKNCANGIAIKTSEF